MKFFQIVQPKWLIRCWNHTYRQANLGFSKAHLTSVQNFNIRLYGQNPDEHWDKARYRGCEKFQREYYDSDDDADEDNFVSKACRNSNGNSSPTRGKRIRQAIGLLGFLIALASAQYLRNQASNEKKRHPVKETKWTCRPYRR